LACAISTVAVLDGGKSAFTVAGRLPSRPTAAATAHPQTNAQWTGPSAVLTSAMTGMAVLALSSGRVVSAGRVASVRGSAVARASLGVVTEGQKVTWKDMTGTVKYVGKVDFSQGTWVGIELDEQKGLHDGSVFGKSYFTAKPKHGVFCPASELAGSAAAPAPAAPATPAAAAPASAAAAPAPAAAGAALAVGQKVSWQGFAGVVQFVGKVGFAQGEWIGVQLDEPKGMHNGSLFGESYFSCPDKTGVFAKSDQLTVVGSAPAAAQATPSPPATAPASPAAPAASTSSTGWNIGQRVSWSGVVGTVMFSGQVDFAAGEWLGLELDTEKGLHDGTVFEKAYFKCKPMHGVFCLASEVTPA